MKTWRVWAGVTVGLLAATLGPGLAGHASDPVGDSSHPSPAPPGTFAPSSDNPKYQAAVLDVPGPEGIWSTIKAVNNTTGTSSTKHIAGFVRVSAIKSLGDEHMHVGWVKGACGGSMTSSPKVFVAYQTSGGSETCTVYTSYFLSAGDNYEFRIRNTSGNNWTAQFKDGTSWVNLTSQNLGFNSTSNYAATALEYTAPSGSYPLLTGTAKFSNTLLDTGSTWDLWDITKSTTKAQDSAFAGDMWMAFGEKWSTWYASPFDPDFGVTTNPASLSIPVGMSKTSTIKIETNVSFPPNPSFSAVVNLTATNNATIGLVQTLSTNSIPAPDANKTYPITLEVTALTPQTSTVNVTITATGGGITKSVVIPVTVTLT